MASGDEVSEQGLRLPTRRPVADDNPSTAITDAISRRQLTLKRVKC